MGINILTDKTMRKILSFLTISILVFFASCDMNTIPEFEDSKAFVAFDNGEITVKETVGIVRIPVTLASIKGMSTEVSFTFENLTAEEEVNFTLASASTTLTFTPQERTQYIEFNIINIPDVFTGDLRFKVTLTDDGKVKPSAENNCTITILDLDHPLSFILGTYKVNAESYFNGDQEWDMVITKDEKDISVVWFANIVGAGTGAGIYGVVNEEKTQIIVPLGQIHQKNGTGSGDGNIYLYGLTSGGNINDEGNLIFNILEDGAKLTVDEDAYGPALNAGGTNSYFDLIFPGYTCIKK